MYLMERKNKNLRIHNSICFLPTFCSIVGGATSRALTLEMAMILTRIMTMIFLEIVMQLMEISVVKNTLSRCLIFCHFSVSPKKWFAIVMMVRWPSNKYQISRCQIVFLTFCHPNKSLQTTFFF